MKKSILLALFALYASLGVVHASTICVDLGTANLTRGSESKQVLALQQFLYEQKLLTATPNGYFGPATVAGVKAFQKKTGLPQVGNTGPATRAALKKASCSNTAVQGTPNTTVKTPSSTSVPTGAVPPKTLVATSSIPTPKPAPAIVYPKPTISNIEKGTLFVGGSSSWSVVIQGSGFATTSHNKVMVKNQSSGRVYTLGEFASPDTMTITLPKTLTQDMYSCGSSCKETLPAGRYDLSVITQGGETKTHFLNIETFSVSSMTGTLANPVKQNDVGVRLGTVSFSPSLAAYVTAMSFTYKEDGVKSGAVSNITFKDEETGQTISSFGQNVTVGAYASKIIGVYGTITTQTPGTISGTVKLTVQDYLGKKEVSFTAPPFLTSISGF